MTEELSKHQSFTHVACSELEGVFFKKCRFFS